MAFFSLTDPPYNILTFLYFGLIFTIVFFINECNFEISSILGVTPVPIDQIGSYAIIIPLFIFSLGKESFNCLLKKVSVFFCFFVDKLSPIQIIALSPFLLADCIFFLISFHNNFTKAIQIIR